MIQCSLWLHDWRTHRFCEYILMQVSTSLRNQCVRSHCVRSRTICSYFKATCIVLLRMFVWHSCPCSQVCSSQAGYGYHIELERHPDSHQVILRGWACATEYLNLENKGSESLESFHISSLSQIWQIAIADIWKICNYTRCSELKI